MNIIYEWNHISRKKKLTKIDNSQSINIMWKSDNKKCHLISVRVCIHFSKLTVLQTKKNNRKLIFKKGINKILGARLAKRKLFDFKFS